MTCKKILPLLLLMMLSSCNSILDCVISDTRPELEDRELSSCQRFLFYNELLSVEMQNASNSDYYISDVATTGNVPDGSTCVAEGMDVRISGTPVDFGTYEFAIEITVKPYIVNEDGSGGICSTQSKKNYSISVIN